MLLLIGTVRRVGSCMDFEMGNSDAVFPVESVPKRDIHPADGV